MIAYLIGALTLGAITAILVMGLNVRWGWSGDLDLAYYVFVALAAYFGAVLQLPPSHGLHGTWILGWNWPFPLGVIGGMVVAAGASAIVGAVALRRLRAEYLAITTVAFTLVMTAVLSQQSTWFNGFDGVYGLQMPLQNTLNLDPQTYSLLFLAFCCAIVLALYFVLEALYKSPFGRTLRTIRENQVAAAAFGRNVYAGKLKAYVIGGVCAGLGGVLLAQWIGNWNPYTWSTSETFLLYTGIFVGGQANNRGIMIGTLLALVFIPQLVLFMPTIPGHGDLWPAMQSVVSGILIILVLRFRPQGILREPKFRDKAGDESSPQAMQLTPRSES